MERTYRNYLLYTGGVDFRSDVAKQIELLSVEEDDDRTWNRVCRELGI